MKKPDTKAASVLFGVELETVIPAGCGVQVGNYHRGVQVTGGLRKSDGTVVTAPKFNRMPWRAEHDGSIRGSGVACEFVSPILHGEAGVAALWVFDLPSQNADYNITADNERSYQLREVAAPNDRVQKGGTAKR